jgi:hypothetical protein
MLFKKHSTHFQKASVFFLKITIDVFENNN